MLTPTADKYMFYTHKIWPESLSKSAKMSENSQHLSLLWSQESHLRTSADIFCILPTYSSGSSTSPSVATTPPVSSSRGVLPCRNCPYGDLNLKGHSHCWRRTIIVPDSDIMNISSKSCKASFCVWILYWFGLTFGQFTPALKFLEFNQGIILVKSTPIISLLKVLWELGDRGRYQGD